MTGDKEKYRQMDNQGTEETTQSTHRTCLFNTDIYPTAVKTQVE